MIAIAGNVVCDAILDAVGNRSKPVEDQDETEEENRNHD